MHFSTAYFLGQEQRLPGEISKFGAKFKGRAELATVPGLKRKYKSKKNIA